MGDNFNYFIPPPPPPRSIRTTEPQLVSSHYLTPPKKDEATTASHSTTGETTVDRNKDYGAHQREHHGHHQPLARADMTLANLKRQEASGPEETLEKVVSDTESDNGGDDADTPQKDYYINRELEKVVFRYGALVPNKIDSNQVPRPKGATLQDTTEEEGKVVSPVSSFIEQKVVEGGVCHTKYIRMTLGEVPVYGDTLKRISIPLAAIVQPFADELDKKVPVIDLVAAIGEQDLSKQNLIRCPKCLAYINPAMEGDSRLDFRICNFCYKGFSLSQAEFFGLGKLKASVHKKSKVSPIMLGSVDFVAPARYYIPIEEKETSISETISNIISKATALSQSIPLGNGMNKDLNYMTYTTYGNAGDQTPAVTSGCTSPMPRANSSVSGIAGNTSSYVPSMNFSMQQQGVDITEEYHKTPSYVIVVDSTLSSTTMSLRNSIINCLRSALVESAIRQASISFCIITFDCVVYLYDIRNGKFNVNIMAEVDEIFSPGCAEELFVQANASNMDEVNKYIDFVLNFATKPYSSLSCANAALSVAISLLADSKRPGTVCMFYTQPPEVGIGKCLKADINQDFSIDESMKLLYDGLIKKCYESGIAVDVYICPKRERMPGDVQVQYLSQHTAGNSWYFSSFNAESDGTKITKNFVRLFTIPHAYRCELKLRASKPLMVVESYCSFQNTRSIIDKSALRVPRLSPDTAISFTLSMDDLASDKRDLHIQVACMYNSSVNGRKLIRVHNQSVKVSTNVTTIFKSADCRALVNLYSRQLAYSVLKTGMSAKSYIVDEIVGALCSYRRLCAPNTPDNQLILPDNLKLLLATINAAFKMYAGDYQCFEFLQKMLRSLLAPADETAYIYSRVYCLHRSVYDPYTEVPQGGWKFTGNTTPASTTQIFSDGMYLVDDAQKLVLYFGPHVKWELLQEIFGQDLVLDDKSVNNLKITDETDTGRNLLDIIERVRAAHVGSQYLNLKILPYCSKQHRLLKLLLLEDDVGSEPNYINFLVQIHKRIRQAQHNQIG